MKKNYDFRIGIFLGMLAGFFIGLLSGGFCFIEDEGRADRTYNHIFATINQCSWNKDYEKKYNDLDQTLDQMDHLLDNIKEQKAEYESNNKIAKERAEILGQLIDSWKERHK